MENSAQPGPSSAPSVPKKAPRTPESVIRKYRVLMIALGVVYALAALVVFFFPSELIYLINVGPQVFHVTRPLPLPVERFWLVQAVAMLAMLSALSFLSAERPEIRGYALVHLLAKVIEAMAFLTLSLAATASGADQQLAEIGLRADQQLNDGPYFAYILAIVLDLVIAATVSWATLRVAHALARKQSGLKASLNSV